MTFEAAFRKLEEKFESMVEEENKKYGAESIFLHNVAPLGPVDFVLIGAEPSRGSWGRTDEEAREKIAKGFRNFGGCRRCEPLHYCVDEFLCRGSGSYYLTDLAKGAVSGTVSWQEGLQKYERWYGLLLGGTGTGGKTECRNHLHRRQSGWILSPAWPERPYREGPALCGQVRGPGKDGGGFPVPVEIVLFRSARTAFWKDRFRV